MSFVSGLQLGNYVIGQARDGLKVLAVRDFLPGGRRYRMERSLDYKGKNDVVAAALQVREFRVEARFYAFLDLLREPGIP